MQFVTINCNESGGQDRDRWCYWTLPVAKAGCGERRAVISHFDPQLSPWSVRGTTVLSGDRDQKVM